mgnify:FL=1
MPGRPRNKFMSLGPKGQGRPVRETTGTRDGLKQRYELGALAVLELVLSLAFCAASRVSGSDYFRGVSVGLLISGVTTAIAFAVNVFRGGG